MIGPGTYLSQFLSQRGHAASGCNLCLGTTRRMDEFGLDWCYLHIKDEIVPAMVQEGMKRQLKLYGVDIPEMMIRVQATRWVKQALREYRRLSVDAGPASV